MDIQNLAPGIYKLKKTGDGTFRLLRVVDKGKAQKYYFGASIKGLHPSKVSNLGDFQVVEKYPSKPAVSDCKVTLSFKDPSGSTFDIPVESVGEVSKIFVALPWLKKHYMK